MAFGKRPLCYLPKGGVHRCGRILPICAILGLVSAFDLPQTQLQLQPGCDPLPLTQQTWKNLNLDKYISEYPGGHNLTVYDYASSAGAKNFKCGISEWCNAGQMCHPVKGLDWYVLFAIQEWNERMNNFYVAVGFTMSLVQASLLSILSALFPQPNNLRIFAEKTHFAMGAALAGLTVGLLSFIPFFAGAPSFTITVLAAAVLIPSIGVNLASALSRYKEAPKDAFGVGSEIIYQMTYYQEQVQQALRSNTHSLLNAGLSNPEGMAGILAGGSYLEPQLFRSVEQIEDQLRNVTVAMSLSHILKSMNAFVTIGSDPCNGRGKDGAWSGDDVLSFCNSNGTMFNIVTVKPGKSKVKNHIPNANVLSSKFGITTEYLTSSAIECQEKRKRSGIVSANSTVTTLANQESMACVIDLPVCDCRSPEFQNRKKHVGTVRACREAGTSI